MPAVLYQTCSMTAYCGEQNVWGKLGKEGKNKVKKKHKNKRELHAKDSCVQHPECCVGLGSLYPSSGVTDGHLMKVDSPIHNFSSTCVLKFIGSNGEGRQKQKQDYWDTVGLWEETKKEEEKREKRIGISEFYVLLFTFDFVSKPINWSGYFWKI